MHDNPFDIVGFQVQICCLTFSPALNSAALYLTLKHLVLQFGREWSRIRPKWYTWAFISADIAALSTFLSWALCPLPPAHSIKLMLFSGLCQHALSDTRQLSKQPEEESRVQLAMTKASVMLGIIL